MIWVGANFGKKEELCPICSLEQNTQKHLTQCLEIRNQFLNTNENNQYNYEDIFGNEPEKMKDSINDLENCLRKRDQLMQNNQYNPEKDQVQFS